MIWVIILWAEIAVIAVMLVLAAWLAWRLWHRPPGRQVAAPAPEPVVVPRLGSMILLEETKYRDHALDDYLRLDAYVRELAPAELAARALDIELPGWLTPEPRWRASDHVTFASLDGDFAYADPYAGHDHNGPGGCPVCVGQITKLAGYVGRPGDMWAVQYADHPAPQYDLSEAESAAAPAGHNGAPDDLPGGALEPVVPAELEPSAAYGPSQRVYDWLVRDDPAEDDGPDYPAAPFIASLSDTDVWPAIRYELRRLVDNAGAPYDYHAADQW